MKYITVMALLKECSGWWNQFIEILKCDHQKMLKIIDTINNETTNFSNESYFILFYFCKIAYFYFIIKFVVYFNKMINFIV